MDGASYRPPIRSSSQDNSRHRTATENENSDLAAIVTRLLSHYWTAADHIEVRRAQLADWLEDLEEYGPAMVASACRDWRRTQSRRPVPSEIRQLCDAQKRAQQERAQVAASTDMDAYARSVGFADNAERMEAIRASKRDTAADGERLKAIERELKFGRVVRERKVTARDTAEELRLGRIALGLEVPEPLEETGE